MANGPAIMQDKRKRVEEVSLFLQRSQAARVNNTADYLLLDNSILSST